ncbi:MAG TPA: HAD-IB family hydrolase [Actinomycetota bacterium]|nr:HAD-IB family hydrolase [Actinomycetota bacterium]
MGSRAAAFFDLDRTLIADSSALAMVEAFSEAGLVSSFEKPLAEAGRFFYRAVGETWIGMQLTRRSIQRLAGWSVEDVSGAARLSVAKLPVYEEARALIDRHHADGHLVVIATSTGRELVEPVAEALGADRLISSEYEKEEGRFTGRLVGQWLWGPDKAEAVRRFAEEEDIDLEESYAYSDSYYDRHLMELVGYPRPVNPDPLLRAYAVRKGWPVLAFGGGPLGALQSLELYDLLRAFGHPMLSPIRVEVEGVENIPASGGCIVAANHRSYVDPLVLGIVASRRGRKLRYLGKKEVFDAPLLGQLARATGQIRVERGTGDEKPLKLAIDAVARGEAAAIFPQGTIPRGRAFFSPKLEGKTGVVRLALATGAPVVPVAMWDTERLWPRSSRVPLVAELARRTPVHARVGEPYHLSAPGGRTNDKQLLHELTEQVMESIASLLPDDVRHPAPPEDDELRKAIPANVDPASVEL